MHYNYIKNYAKENNIKIKRNNISKKYLDPNWNKKTNFYNSYNYPYTKISRFLRKFIKCFYFNRHFPIHKIILGIINRKKFLSLGSFDQVKAEYIFQSKNFYYHIAWVDLISKNKVSMKIKK